MEPAIAARALLLVVHGLVAGVWLGAMCYSAFVVQPRARAYFAQPEEFEAFVASVSQGARWKVLLAMALLGGSGALLLLVPGRGPSIAAPWLIGAKAVLLLAATGVFVYVSWRLWPARVFAAPAEIPRFQRAFGGVAVIMVGIASAAFALGVLLYL